MYVDACVCADGNSTAKPVAVFPVAKIMSYLFSCVAGVDWKHAFDVIIVDARKPLFFAGGR